jgi:dynein heavy chain, axonemal
MCRIVSAKEPQDSLLPGEWNSKLSPFDKLVLVRCLRPDKMVPAIHNYVMQNMGKRYVEPQTFRLEPIFADSQASVPLIFVLSQGSDPMADLLTFAEEKCKRVEAVSLGQGQGPVAESWIKEGIAQGFWVVLQNCYLAKTFLPRSVACSKHPVNFSLCLPAQQHVTTFRSQLA